MILPGYKLGVPWSAHDLNCDALFEFYAFECCCGATRPRHPDFVPYNPDPASNGDDEQPPAAPTADTKKE